MQSIPKHSCQGDDVLALGGSDQPRFPGKIIQIERDDVPDEGIHLDEQVAEAGGVEIGPVGEDALDQGDESMP